MMRCARRWASWTDAPLAGVITSIGARRDALAVEPLGKLLTRPNLTVVSATAAALGSIGTVPAAKALEAVLPDMQPSLRPAVCSSIIQCADALRVHGSRAEAIGIYNRVRASKAPPLFHAAAIRGLILAGEGGALELLARELHAEDTAILGPVQRDLPGAEVTEVLAAELAKLPAQRQVLVVQALSMRGDAAAIRALTNAARSRREVRPARGHPRDGRQPRVRARPVRVGGGCRGGAGQSGPGKSGQSSRGRGRVRLAARRECGVHRAGYGRPRPMPLRQCSPAARPAADWPPSMWRAAAASAPRCRRCCNSRARQTPRSELPRSMRPPNWQARPTCRHCSPCCRTPATLPTPSRPNAPAPNARWRAVTAARRRPGRGACAEKLAGQLAGAPLASRGALLRVIGAVGGGGRTVLRAVRTAP